jgi:TnpA family transposase
MTAIERTAYPRLRTDYASDELNFLFTPTNEEMVFTRSCARGISPLLSLTVLLKVFQCLGYFPALAEIPQGIITHVRSCLGFAAKVQPLTTHNTVYRYHRLVREHLGVASWGDAAKSTAQAAITQAARSKDNPADLINVALERLIMERYELPAYRTLQDLVIEVRASVNVGFYDAVHARLSDVHCQNLEYLLVNVVSAGGKSPYNGLKQLPKSPTLTHLHDMVVHLVWLSNLPDVELLLTDVPHERRLLFAAEAKALDASELREFAPPKRYTLILSLIWRARATTRDHIVEMFLRRIAMIQRRAKEELERILSGQRSTTESLVATFGDVLRCLENEPADDVALSAVKLVLESAGGTRKLLTDCNQVSGYTSGNYLPLVWKYYRSHRSTMMQILRVLDLDSSNADRSLVEALRYMLQNESRKGEWLEEEPDLSFASELWQRTVKVRQGQLIRFSRKHFEACVFSCLASELKTGDIYVVGSEQYADYRDQLLEWHECEPLVGNYCEQVGLPQTAAEFVEQLKGELSATAASVDELFPNNASIEINDKGEPVLKKVQAAQITRSALDLEMVVLERIKERNLLDVLADVDHWVHFTRHFGPLSGSDPKLERPRQRYVLTTFCYGTNLGPHQASRHLRGLVSAHELGFTNTRHINSPKLEAALADVIDRYNTFALPKLWGSGKTAAADGTQVELPHQNPFASYHIRYGGYGGIAYHHISDTYIALFTHFIPCGVWEAVYILEGLLKNKSAIQPDTVYADTQGQSAPVFGLAYLLGINLMPRIRNWSDLKFFRPDKQKHYQHIDSLFTDSIDWELLETHWPDLMRVVLSIQTGKISSAVLLRKLGNYSRKNRLYQAFRELGQVVRTEFLLRYISNIHLRGQITAVTNKVEAYNGFSKWCTFGGEMTTNDREEQEKAVKYHDLVAAAIVFRNVVDITNILRQLKAEGYTVLSEDIATLSPYLVRHIKRFGEYWLDSERVPEPLDPELVALF